MLLHKQSLLGVQQKNQEGVEEQSKDTKTEAQLIHSYREAIKGPGAFSIDPPGCRGSVEIAIRKSLRS